MKPKYAIIPLAGLASRLYPATKVLPKALLPIPGRDGTLRPVVDWIVREASNSNVEQIILVLSPRDGELIIRYFTEPPTENLETVAGKRILNAWNDLKGLGDRLQYIYQQEPGGFGDAILQAKEIVGSETFVILLGDHLYKSYSPISCIQQVLNVGLEFGKGVLGVCRRNESEIHQLGVLGVRAIPNQATIYELTDMREKPSLNTETATLRIPGTKPHQYFCILGIYLLPGKFMEYLENAKKQQSSGELDLSAALQTWISKDGGLAFEVAGNFFDVGTPGNFRDTVIGFSEFF
ncbi:sugar phosphate nucleotidyltransferase [Floridanema evergladense]|uniref:UTP--glucose-1-phosphate uridylyltransferase n=1 Tax=Floridaenema evergladense BLCC-F167 TaxID=3153639 RepID=A0ABV4WWP3_9CYAN